MDQSICSDFVTYHQAKLTNYKHHFDLGIKVSEWRELDHLQDAVLSCKVFHGV
jgi:hypothetical protein